MGKFICAIEKCSRTNHKQTGASPSQRVSFFSFPKDDEILRKWLDFVNQHNKQNKLDRESLDRKRLRLCHLHFQRKYIREGKKERALMPNSVPEHAVGTMKYKTRSKKSKPTAASGKASPASNPPASAANSSTATTTPSADGATDETGKPESAPLYHSINGYVVDLRFASQLEMFRLPNGKLIQVRKQAKKAPAAATTVAAPPDSENASAVEKEKVAENPKDKVAAPTTVATPPDSEVTSAVEKEKVAEKPKDKVATPTTVATPPESEDTSVTEKEKVAEKSKGKNAEGVSDILKKAEAKKIIERAAKKKRLVIPQSGPQPEKPAVHYKTYMNRRSQGAPVTTTMIPRIPPQTSAPVEITVLSVPVTELPTSAPTPVSIRPPNPMPQIQPQRPRRPVVAPCLTALQNLVFKTHDEITPFDLFQKQFENQLISTAEIGLHVVAKINNLINSNPFKTAETESDLKYMYHHVGYILKYAIDRFTGLTETCASDIKNMGFTQKADLGPVFGAAVKDPEPAARETSETTTEPTATTPAESDPKEDDEDEDCAIVEEQPDMIEIDSDDDDDQPDQSTPEKTTTTADQPKAKAKPTPKSRSLQICSDTESAPEVENRHAPSRSTSSSESEESADGEEQDQFIISEIDEPRGVIRQDSETTLKIANVIEQYYRQESESEEEQEEEEAKQAEPMEVDEPDKPPEPESQDQKETPSNATESEEDEEETTELIEIIDGDDEQETDNDPEYSVVECGDGDYYLVTTDGDEV